MKSGNKCLYYCKQFFNLLLGMSGLLMIAIAIYIWVVAKIFSVIVMCILVLGGIQLFLSLISLGTKKAMFRIKFYNFFLGFILLGQITITILAFVLEDQFIDKAIEKLDEPKETADALKDQLKNQYTRSIFITLASLGIQIMCFVFSVWYRDSLENANDNSKLLYDEKEKKYMSFEEYSQKQQAQVKDKSNNNRNEVYSRNPEFYEWKQQQQGKK
ncbi:unnamed protein product [Paramecium octaurelia]|uniref:Transmembrane protein n=1 Tax=Paramecium octaurelia TaxID=43137 RepID=A0A8S1VPH7_PAROT|nr:unnamed protein product [Paramecium octaurelia]